MAEFLTIMKERSNFGLSMKLLGEPHLPTGHNKIEIVFGGVFVKFLPNRKSIALLLMTFLSVGALLYLPQAAEAGEAIKIYINGRVIATDTAPVIVNDRTMVPIRVISESLGMDVDWDGTSRIVYITAPKSEVIAAPKESSNDQWQSISILGEPMVSSQQLRALALKNNPNAPDLADLYIKIGKEYGVRGDIAFCQAAKETGWWEYGGLVEPEQYNYCGLSATGAAAVADEDLRGADPRRVWFEEGRHGAFFDCPATGVEAHIQHLYAYAAIGPLPVGKSILSPRFTLIKRGNSVNWEDLGGKWAVPGYDRNKHPDFATAFANYDTYGHSIINDYYKKVWEPNDQVSGPAIVISAEERIRDLERENQALREQIATLKMNL